MLVALIGSCCLVASPFAAAFSAPVASTPASSTSTTAEIKATNLLQNWWPVTLEGALDAEKPNPVELLGKTLVLYNSGDAWNCLEDRCSHRFAPLSEGRVIETENSNEKLLQCAYHGWEFQPDGTLQLVPQNDNNPLPGSNCAGKIQNYPVREAAGMLWVWPDLIRDKAESTPLHVSNLLKEYIKGYPGAGFMRDLPYGYELLAENLLDVSHLPFSHHGTGGFDRDQARPLNLKLMSQKERVRAAEQEAHNSPLYQAGDPLATPILQGAVQNASITDPTLVMLAKRGRHIAENATSSSAFYAPSHIRYRRCLKGNMGANIELFLCPTAPGKSRVFLFTSVERVLKRTLRASVEEQKGWLGKFKQRLINSRISLVVKPSVEGHLVSHDIFDGDGIFLQKQGDRMGRYDLSPSKYYTPTTADVLVLAFRRWLSAAATITAAAGDTAAAQAASGVGAYHNNAPERTRSEMLNRYETHTKNCPTCLKALAKLHRKRSILMAVKTIFLGSIGATCAAPLMLGSLTRKMLSAAILGIVGSAVANLWLKKVEERRVQKFYYVDYVHAER